MVQVQGVGALPMVEGEGEGEGRQTSVEASERGVWKALTVSLCVVVAIRGVHGRFLDCSQPATVSSYCCLQQIVSVNGTFFLCNTRVRFIFLCLRVL